MCVKIVGVLWRGVDVVFQCSVLMVAARGAAKRVYRVISGAVSKTKQNSELLPIHAMEWSQPKKTGEGEKTGCFLSW